MADTRYQKRKIKKLNESMLSKSAVHFKNVALYTRGEM